METLFSLIVVLGIFAASLVIYFFPTIVAGNRRSRYTGPIFVLNLFAGWTIILWIVALAWALMPVDPPRSPPSA